MQDDEPPGWAPRLSFLITCFLLQRKGFTMSFSSKTKIVALMAVVIAMIASFSSTSEAGWRHRCCPPICCDIPACTPVVESACTPVVEPACTPVVEPACTPVCAPVCAPICCPPPCCRPCLFWRHCCNPCFYGPYTGVVTDYGCGSCGGGVTVPEPAVPTPAK